ncbi:MAG: hypothetical protein IH962_01265 [Chloroflexi bacterium]|nr:hypothetical protein [Chloroflexota bacterium]
MRLGLIGLAIAIGLLSWAGQEPGTGSAQGLMTMEGKVVNGTGGATLPDGLMVLVLVADQEGRAVHSAQAIADETGGFQIPALPVMDGARYSFSVEYAGVRYGTVLSVVDLPEQLEITVYETTSDVSAVVVTKQVTVLAQIDRKEQEISAIEFIRLTNESDRTVMPDLANPAQMSFLRFSLPPQTSDLNVNSDLPSGEIINVGTGFAITSPVIPGDHSVEYSYVFPYRDRVLSFRQAFHQGAQVYQVLIPDRFSQIRVEPLERVSSLNIQGTAYHAWEQRGFLRGQEVSLSLRNLPQPGLLVRVQKAAATGVIWHFTLPGVLGVALASLLIFAAFKSPAHSAAGETGPVAEEPTSKGPGVE